MTKLSVGKLSGGALSVGILSTKPKKIDIKHDADEVTEECAEELSIQAQQIAKQESKLAERMDFDNDRTYTVQIVFRGTKERNEWLAKKGIKLRSDNFVFYDDIKDKI